ncbi:hypothetical protein RPB_0988 [Rhodopseudomonas palustris HaA2]|uniref:Uncharacterized protein n=1 Tax=Rhodopseudomonas palustris (strain HaA2) TaxID=316058 RepID=Q2J1G2_RHOP2|nr:hypothetical protein RPB_0988 [Rhodopseudomonas palustris HaA2]
MNGAVATDVVMAGLAPAIEVLWTARAVLFPMESALAFCGLDMQAATSTPYHPSLRVAQRRSNPEAPCSAPLDCFAALAMTGMGR